MCLSISNSKICSPIMQQLFYSTVLGIWKMIALTLYRTNTILNNWWGLWSSQLPTMLQIPMTEPYPWNYTPNTSEDIKNPSQSTQFKVLKCYHIQATDAKRTRCKLYRKSAKRRLIKTLPNSLKAKWNTCRGSGNNNGLVNWQCERFCQNYRWR